eukprot:2233797-Rhodomonas_salina.1
MRLCKRPYAAFLPYRPMLPASATLLRDQHTLPSYATLLHYQPTLPSYAQSGTELGRATAGLLDKEALTTEGDDDAWWERVQGAAFFFLFCSFFSFFPFFFGCAMPGAD